MNVSGGGDLVCELRGRLGEAIFRRVAGPDGPQHRKHIHGADGERWFADDRPIRQVHADAAMFVGGLRALLLQSLHPSAMAAVADHSDYRDDPWGRLARTSYFLAVTTFGTASEAGAAVARVRAVHAKVTGTTPEGTPYRADDPHLLGWVHVAEVDSFLTTYQRFSGTPLSSEQRDAYVEDTAVVGRALGVDDPPTSHAQLCERLAAYRPELRGTSQARDAARYLLLRPPIPWPARPPYGVLAAAAIASLPRWSRRPLQLPLAPLAEATVVNASGRLLVRGIGWAMTSPAA